MPEPPSYVRCKTLVDKALVRAQRGDYDVLDDMLSAAYKQWANTSEKELCNVMGITLPFYGARGKGVSLWWRPILGRDRGAPRYPVLHNMRWLNSNFQAVVRLCEGRSAALS